ncbi:MAG: hypothetical protein ACRCXX_12835 [Cetobacterium sp.]|uniref:hypothetical protein n=1 Tax=Cetobacterium sp. TaxID=2071632 RepID=UPI003F391C56
MSYSRENLIIKAKDSNQYYSIEGDYLEVYSDLLAHGILGGTDSIFERAQAFEEVYKRFTLPNGDVIEGFLYHRVNDLVCSRQFVGSHRIDSAVTVDIIEMYELANKMYTREEMVAYIENKFMIPEGKVINLNLRNRSSVFVSDDSYRGGL